MQRLLFYLFIIFSFKSFAQDLTGAVDKQIASVGPNCIDVYKKLHAAPELSTNEFETGIFLKSEMRQLGFEIIDSLGYNSFAAILRNGNGPVVLYRTDIDGLPVLEKTDFSFISKATAKRGEETLPVMHACGHDIHMSTWLGTARVLSQIKKQWSGTVVFLAQSAEETGQGAKLVIASNNFKKIPKATYQIGMHSHASLPVGSVGFCDGYSMAAVDMMTVTMYGKGGHGAAPEKCIDPILMAAQFITAIQTIISRNLSSNDPAVITVGSFHGGNAHNIIPDKVELKLTIRSYSDESRQLILDRIKTIGDNIALAAGMDKNHLPEYNLGDMSIPALYNDPALGETIRNTLKKQVPSASIQNVKPVMLGEDFGIYGKQLKVPSYFLWMGTVSPERKALADSGRAELFSLHSSGFNPDYEHTIPAAMRIMSMSVLYLLKEKQ